MKPLELRKRILFDTNPADFAKECAAVRQEAEKIFRSGKEAVEAAVAIREVAIDLQSYLVNWNLCAGENALTQEAIDIEVAAFYKLLKSFEYDQEVRAAEMEAKNIAESNIKKIADLTKQGVLNNQLGNDAYYGLTNAMRRGCVLVTTNPVMINTACHDLAETKCLDLKNQIKREHPDADAAKLVTYITAELVYQYCTELFPVYKASNGKYGYISLQVNPRNAGNGEKMFAELDFIYSLISERLGCTPNLVFKVPATAAGLDTVAKMTQKGIGVNVTGSCSVAQVAAMAEIIEKGNSKVNFLTIMSGRLDDRIADELKEQGVEDAVEVSRHASGLVIAKAYDLLYRQKGYTKAFLLAASMRGPWNVAAALANGDVPVYITLFPPKSEEYDAVPRENRCEMGDPVSEHVLETLEKSKLFRQAYYPDGLKPEEFAEFFPVKVTLESFCKNYDQTVDYMLS